MTGSELRNRRKELGLSQKALASKIGLTETTIWRNEQEEGDKYWSPIQNPTLMDLALKTLEREHELQSK